MRFFIAGVMDSMYRDGVENLIRRYGGIVDSVVSEKTTYALVGTHCTSLKITRAMGLGIMFMDEDGLFAVIRGAMTDAEKEAENEKLGIEADRRRNELRKAVHEKNMVAEMAAD